MNKLTNTQIVIIVCSIVVLLLVIKGIDSYFKDKTVQKNYRELQKKYNSQKKDLEKLNALHEDMIKKLEKGNLKLRDSLIMLNTQLKSLENEKPKIIYRTANMSVSEQQKYFTDRYKEGSSPRFDDSSSGDSRPRTRRPVLQAVRDQKPSGTYFRERYG